jgi:hypothetical protein
MILDQTTQLDTMLSEIEPLVDQTIASVDRITRANDKNNRDLIRLAVETGGTHLRDIQITLARMHTMIIRMHAAMQALQQEAAPDDDE